MASGFPRPVPPAGRIVKPSQVVGGDEVGLDQRCTLDPSGRRGRDVMSGGRRRDRALTPTLWALLTVLAIMLGASPASAAGHRSSAPAHLSEGAYVVAQEQIGPHLVDLTIQSP